MLRNQRTRRPIRRPMSPILFCLSFKFDDQVFAVLTSLIERGRFEVRARA